ncbi:hypothetical protein PSY24_23585, partial [Shigella flexneri]|nr:hypothetical protein [Shigella flexneri]
FRYRIFQCLIGFISIFMAINIVVCHEDADKANQALKDAVTELMENEEIPLPHLSVPDWLYQHLHGDQHRSLP